MNLAAHDIIVAMVVSSLKNLVPFALMPISVTTRLIKTISHNKADCHSGMAIPQYAINPRFNLIEQYNMPHSGTCMFIDSSEILFLQQK